MSHSLSHPLPHHIQLPITYSVFLQKFIPHAVAFPPLPYLLPLPHLPFSIPHHPFPPLSLPPLQLHLPENSFLTILQLLDFFVNACYINPLFRSLLPRYFPYFHTSYIWSLFLSLSQYSYHYHNLLIIFLSLFYNINSPLPNPWFPLS